MRHQSFWRRLLRRRPKRQSFFESQHVMIAAIEREARASRNASPAKEQRDPPKSG